MPLSSSLLNMQMNVGGRSRGVCGHTQPTYGLIYIPHEVPCCWRGSDAECSLLPAHFKHPPGYTCQHGQATSYKGWNYLASMVSSSQESKPPLALMLLFW